MFRHELSLVGALTTHVPTAAIVGDRIAINAAPQGVVTPYIAVTTTLTADVGLAGNVLAYFMQAVIQCWSKSALEASLLADQAQTALRLAGYHPAQRSAGYDDDLGLDAVLLTVEAYLTTSDVDTTPIARDQWQVA